MKKIVNQKNNIIFFIICFIISLFSLKSGFENYRSEDSQRRFYGLGLLTRQNDLIVNLVMFSYFINLIKNNKKNNKMSKFFSYLSLNCFVNCFFVLFFSFTKNFFDRYFFEHKILTLTFIFYYFFIDKTFISPSQFYIGFIHIWIYILVSSIILIYNKELFPYSEFFEKFDLIFLRLILMFLGFFIILFCTYIFIIEKNKIIQK